MRHTCRVAALTYFAVASGSCQPDAANVERTQATAGAQYAEAIVRRDSVRALRATFSDSALQTLGFQNLDSLLVRMEEVIEEFVVTLRDQPSEADSPDPSDPRSRLRELLDQRWRATALGVAFSDSGDDLLPPPRRDSVRVEFERRFPGALVRFDAWTEWRRIEFGDDQTPSRSSRYALFTECTPVKLSRFGETGTGGNAGVIPESRLRAARIWGGPEPDDGEYYPLVLGIDQGARRAMFRKEVWDPLSGEFRVTEVWVSSLFGAESEADLPQRVSTLIDRFILEYMRVNEGYCQ